MTDKIKKEEIKDTTSNEGPTTVSESVTQPSKKVIKRINRAKNVAVAPVTAPEKQEVKSIPAPQKMGDLIWAEIKDREFSMFGLPATKISDKFVRAEVEPNKLYLTTNVSSSLPALESVLQAGYTIEVVYKYIVISKK